MLPPYLLLDGYLWSSEPFSRISTKNQKQEFFTQLPKPDKYSLHGGCLEVVPETKEILYGHRDGLWLLSLQADNYRFEKENLIEMKLTPGGETGKDVSSKLNFKTDVFPSCNNIKPREDCVSS